MGCARCRSVSNKNRQRLPGPPESVTVPEAVERHDPEGVDYAWVMQVTFVLTIVVGAPVVALLSTGTTLPTWGARLEFTIRVGSVVWIAIGLTTFFYARKQASRAGRV